VVDGEETSSVVFSNPEQIVEDIVVSESLEVVVLVEAES